LREKVLWAHFDGRVKLKTAARRSFFVRETLMSAIGPKQTWACALHMSAFGGKADMPFCTAYVCF